MKFKEFIDRLLVRLYELDQKQPGQYFSLIDIAAQLKEAPPDQWILDAAKLLRTMNYASVEINSMAVQARLTGYGRLYVEDEKGTVKDVQADQAKYYMTITGNNNVVNAGSGSQNVTIHRKNNLTDKLLQEMQDALKRDNKINNDEALRYLQLVSVEMKKPEPNQNILAAILEPLSKIASIAGKVATLVQIING